MRVKCYWYDEYDTPSPTDTRTVRNDSYEYCSTVPYCTRTYSEHHKDYEKLIITITVLHNHESRSLPSPPPLLPTTNGTYWYLLPTSICLEGSTRRGRYESEVRTGVRYCVYPHPHHFDGFVVLVPEIRKWFIRG